MLIRISKRFILGFYWFGKPLRASTIMNCGLVGETVPLYACAIAGGVEGYLYPDRYVSTTQFEKIEKKRQRQQGRICYGEVVSTNTVNDQEGAAFYHHMTVKQVTNILHDSKYKRLVSCNHKLLDDLNKQGIQCANLPFYAKDQNGVLVWCPQNMPIKTIRTREEPHHMVHAVFEPHDNHASMSYVRCKPTQKRRLQ